MKRYDLFFSLGGSCAATRQLRFRGLQNESLPLDWISTSDKKTIRAMADSFENDFRTFLEKDDLVYVKTPYVSEKKLYMNTKSGWFFPHEFHSDTIRDDEFAAVKAKYDRRFERLYRKINTAKRICCLLTLQINPDLADLEHLARTIRSKWKNKVFDFIVTVTDVPEHTTFNKKICADGMTIYEFARPHTPKDCDSLHPDYDFLNECGLSISARLKKIFKKGPRK